jgi:hypothetical protein
MLPGTEILSVLGLLDKTKGLGLTTRSMVQIAKLHNHSSFHSVVNHPSTLCFGQFQSHEEKDRDSQKAWKLMRDSFDIKRRSLAMTSCDHSLAA